MRQQSGRVCGWAMQAAVGSAGTCQQEKAGGDWCSDQVVLGPWSAYCSGRLAVVVPCSPDLRGKVQQDSVRDLEKKTSDGVSSTEQALNTRLMLSIQSKQFVQRRFVE